MRVAEYDRYGDPESVLVVREAKDPGKPAKGEVLVRVHAAALNPKDILARAGKYPLLAGFRFPKRQGYDWAGEAIEVSASLDNRIKPGDRLCGMIQAWEAGACGEMILAKHDELAPTSLPYEEAATLPLAGCTALQAIRDLGALSRGQRILINGASGGVGVFATQIARELGAHVTTLTSDKNRDFAREDLGAHEALSYENWDPKAMITEPYDVIFDVFGNRRFADLRHLLTFKGTFVSTVPKTHVIAAHVLTKFSSGRRAHLVVVQSRSKDIAWLVAAAERKAIRPIIDRVFPLDEIAAANRHIATKRTKGKVVIAVTAK